MITLFIMVLHINVARYTTYHDTSIMFLVRSSVHIYYNNAQKHTNLNYYVIFVQIRQYGAYFTYIMYNVIKIII